MKRRRKRMKRRGKWIKRRWKGMKKMETNEQGKMSVNHVMAETRYIRFYRNFIV